MNKYISVICIILVTAGLAACAKTPAPATGNSPEQQRANSREAQDELSTDVKR
jgi:type IV pilus biogenesis protein CpaD/CtpE